MRKVGYKETLIEKKQDIIIANNARLITQHRNKKYENRK